tara:strand:+ start:4293 stop:5555 length:1263 start_codon:yes stop_codon:yes gene_type:complete
MGGAAGHMAHLHEDLDLTFNELVSILNQVASADIEVVEKVDGQNLFLTVNSLGEIRSARNTTDIKKGGMSTSDYASKWKGHPAEDAFMKGFRAIGAAINSLDQEDVIDIFDGGKSYVNMEIMYPGNPNIIIYGASYVVLHNLVSIDEGETSESFERLRSALDSAQVEIDGEAWSVYGPQVIPLNNIAAGKAHQEVVDKIQKLASPVGMDGTIKSLCKIYYKNLMLSEDIPVNVCNEIIKNVFKEPDGASLRDIKKVYGKTGELSKKISKYCTKVNAKKVIGVVLRPLENIINDFAIEVLRGIKSFFVVDHDTAVQSMREELEESISYLESLAESGDEKMGKLVDRQLAKLGSIENVASSLEGIVFEKDGKLYKMTGAFAMANQIIGRARRTKPRAESANEGIVRVTLRQLKTLIERLFIA